MLWNLIAAVRKDLILFFHTLWVLMELLSDLNVWKSGWGMLFLMEDSLAATQLSLPGNHEKHTLEI